MEFAVLGVILVCQVAFRFQSILLLEQARGAWHVGKKSTLSHQLSRLRLKGHVILLSERCILPLLVSMKCVILETRIGGDLDRVTPGYLDFFIPPPTESN